MSPIDAQVIIVGGGIGGLTLAAICKRLGLTYKVLERTEEVRPVGAGISLAPNALRLLDQLGLYEKILASGQKLQKVQIYRNTRRWSVLDWSSCETTFGYPVISIERHYFHGLLYEAAGGSEHVRFGSKVVDVVDDPAQGTASVILESGETLCSNVVVGADGIRSGIRRALARNSGITEANANIKFTGRVHFSGITKPLENLTSNEIGVANWVLYDDSILTTWPCPNNSQWFIGVKVSMRDTFRLPTLSVGH
jgi:salicylate hydroxylase